MIGIANSYADAHKAPSTRRPDDALRWQLRGTWRLFVLGPVFQW